MINFVNTIISSTIYKMKKKERNQSPYKKVYMYNLRAFKSNNDDSFNSMTK